ncbi:MAG: PepSY domain-containing protein [Planctomycetes bacterium]|nr:PepSY domain-containing protein [Planctomycetota bacterium]MCP4770244.1 PepSY domain-containing protein [Planctomycetota bacterium]MCP4860608.1 PepSY domain-containing protein [Planctomycetota bacterium]
MSIYPRLARRWHRIGGIVIAIPFLVVIISGLLLQMKKEFTWIQPATQKGAQSVPELSFEQILTATSAVPEAEVASWEDIDRLDVRPGKGMLKVQCKNGVEVQLDASSATVLQVAMRRSDLIEGLHDGSFFHDNAKLWLFLPSGVVVLFLWLSGVYLWWLPHGMRRRKKQRRIAKEA